MAKFTSSTSMKVLSPSSLSRLNTPQDAFTNNENRQKLNCSSSMNMIHHQRSNQNSNNNINNSNNNSDEIQATLLHVSRMRRRLQRQMLIQIDQEQSMLLQSQRSLDFTNTIPRSCTIPIHEDDENENNDDAHSCNSSLTSCVSDDS